MNGEAPVKTLVQVFAVKGQLPDEDEISYAGLPIMDGWELMSLSADGFDLMMNFTDPLRISSGDEPDLLLIQLDLSDFEDADGNKLSESVVKYLQIPTQMGSAAEAKQVQDQGDTAGSSSKASIGSNLVVNILMSGSMSQVWQMINGLQVVNHMPLFKIKSPGNINAFNDFFSEIAKFEIVDTNALTLEAGIYVPEMDSISLNYQNAGYDTTIAIPCLGTLVLIIFAQTIIVAVHVLINVLSKYCDRVKWLESKIARYLYWNGLTRFFMEAYLDFVMLSLLNIKTMGDQDDRFMIVKASKYLSFVLLTLSLLLPVVMCIVWACKYKQWD